MPMLRFAIALLFTCTALLAEDSGGLIRAGIDRGGWTFDNGAEFPGAVGSLAIDDQVEPQRRPALALQGDFAKGGNYVQALVEIPGKAELDRLAFWLKAPGGKHLSLRLIDGSGQCHQLGLRLAGVTGWQRVEVPIGEFFALLAKGRSLPVVERYEFWGGANDGHWHGAISKVALLAGKDSYGGTAGTLWLSGVQAITVDAGNRTKVSAVVRLDDFLNEGVVDWGLSLGTEFPGAQGTLTAVADQPSAGAFALRLQGDFTKGGAYIGAQKDLTGLAIEAIRLRVRSTVPTCGFRLIDATGQCHQRKQFPLAADGAWHDLTLKPSEIAGGEHWGGANDGKWHSPAKLIALTMGTTGEILLSDIRAEVIDTVQAAAPAYQEGFETAGTLPTDWKAEGDVAIAAGDAAAGTRALILTRDQKSVEVSTRAIGAWFPATPGHWTVGGAAATRLVSPDASFCLLIAIEAGDASGKALATREVAAPFGDKGWQRFATAVEFPVGTTQARFTLTMAKAYGKAAVDGLTAAMVTGATHGDPQIDRIELSTARIGNLLFPEDPVTLIVDVPAKHPLPATRRTVEAVVRDFWGAEVGTPVRGTLERKQFANGRMTYRVELDLSTQPLEIGRYYEAHVVVPGGEATEYTGFARLPLAETKALKPADVPITIRSWDGRIKEYIQLADRLGIRRFGLWGRTNAKPPYEPGLPQGDLVQELGGTWLTGTMAATVEHEGFKNISEDNLRQGMTEFLQQFAGKGLQALCQGNEPPEDVSKIPEKVVAYKAIYEAVKAFDPKIEVIGTSVGANEAFFAAGFQNYLDAYDFHVYESHLDVRRAMRSYRTMMEKYHAVKPIHSTELGLNSQGMSRHAVAVEMVKKLTSFFAEGGASASWFGIMYPDHEGTGRGSSGSAHNVFDCQYSLYNPKLDAVMYYHLINGFAARHFVQEAAYDDGTEAYLFRDAVGTCLQILWNDKATVDVQVPLVDASDIHLVRVDGSSVALMPDVGGIGLRVSAEPVLLRYRQAAGKLPDALAAPRLHLVDGGGEIIKGASATMRVSGPGLTAEQVKVLVPTGWQSSCTTDGGGQVTIRLASPITTGAREGRIQIQRLVAGGVAAELSLGLAMRSPVQVIVVPFAAVAAKAGGIDLTIRNGGSETRTMTWSAMIDSAFPESKGGYRLTDPQQPQAALVGDVDGQVKLAAGAERRMHLVLRDGDIDTLYRVRVTAHDEEGREQVVSRFIGGFGQAVHARTAPSLDGKLDEPMWATAPVLTLERADQVVRYGVNQAPARAWGGPAELSANVRLAWDEQNLYLGVTVHDDIYRATGHDGELWRMDGLQMLVDPFREQETKAGKYDYTMGVGTAGPQAFCHLSARADVPSGLVRDITVTMAPGATGGDRTYEIAIPWTRLAPFKPHPGADLGLCLIVNDDDGQGRDGFIGWFSGAHNKETDLVGDIILGE